MTGGANRRTEMSAAEPGIQTEEELMRRIAAGDRRAFELLVKRYSKPILNFNYRFLGDPAEAEDLTQEVFLRVWKAAGTYRPQARFTTWLYRIAANLCINRRRSLKIRKWLPLPDPESPPAGSDGAALSAGSGAQTTPEDDLIQFQLSAEVRAALDALPASQRLAIVLKVYDGLTYHEISRVLGRSAPAVDSLLIRAKKSLRKKLALKK
jgi:RNA polymerase sigma-70 factor (ECF subfamily)